MSKPVYKILLFMKRKAGMSMAEFQDYYETRHAPLCARYSQRMTRYMRRFLEPQPTAENREPGELPFDVITELWFDDEATFQGTVAYLSQSIMPDEIVEDEGRLFDRGALRMATVVEYETQLEAR